MLSPYTNLYFLIMYAMEYASSHVFEIFILFLMNYLLGLLIHFLIELFIFSWLRAVHSAQILDNSLLSNMTSPAIFNCLLFPYNSLPQITKIISFFIDCVCYFFKCYYQAPVCLGSSFSMNLYSIKWFLSQFCEIRFFLLNSWIKTLQLSIILGKILMVYWCLTWGNLSRIFSSNITCSH